jgi:hypothetical protein
LCRELYVPMAALVNKLTSAWPFSAAPISAVISPVHPQKIEQRRNTSSLETLNRWNAHRWSEIAKIRRRCSRTLLWTESIPNQDSRALVIQQTCRGSLSAVSKPFFCKKTIQPTHLATNLRSTRFAHLRTCAPVFRQGYLDSSSTWDFDFCTAPNSTFAEVCIIFQDIP